MVYWEKNCFKTSFCLQMSSCAWQFRSRVIAGSWKWRFPTSPLRILNRNSREERERLFPSLARWHIGLENISTCRVSSSVPPWNLQRNYVSHSGQKTQVMSISKIPIFINVYRLWIYIRQTWTVKLTLTLWWPLENIKSKIVIITCPSNSTQHLEGTCVDTSGC